MEYYVAWWNVENLFDVADSVERPAWLQSRLRAELVGWDSAVLNAKIQQLALIISQMNDNRGPDLLGVCEVENKAVLNRLTSALVCTGRNYAVVHSDTDDARGIDVAFIYDTTRFHTPDAGEVFNHVVLKRNATRDIVQVNFKTRTPGQNCLVVLGNHWPSKLGGAHDSEPYRIIAAETMSYWMERIYAKLGKDVPILVMGDFNDEPFSRAMTDYALAIKDASKVKSKRSQNPYLYNLMWRLLAEQGGTHYFDGWGMLDQILVNRPLLRSESPLQLIAHSCQIINPSRLLKSGKPRRFSRPSAGRSYDPDGYSDHLPVSVRLKELD